MWKYKGCPFGDDPTQWPPRILAALAALARVAGAAHRIRAMHLIAHANKGPGPASPEHIASATGALSDFLRARADDEDDDGSFDRDVAALRRHMLEKFAEKDVELEDARMEWYEMDARLVTACVDRDMYAMYHAAEQHRAAALGRENAALRKDVAAKDKAIVELAADRDSIMRKNVQLEEELMQYKRLAAVAQRSE